MKTILFACTHNAGRSQMAAAFLRMHAGEACRALSAGTQPANAVHPEVVLVMMEVGLDLNGVRPQKLTPELAQQADMLITMGCGENCPYVPGLRVVDWALPDPKGQPLEVVRGIRDQIHERVLALLREECGAGSSPKTPAR